MVSEATYISRVWQRYHADANDPLLLKRARRALDLGWQEILVPVEDETPNQFDFPHIELRSQIPSRTPSRCWILHTRYIQSATRVLPRPDCVEVTLAVPLPGKGLKVISMREGGPPRHWDPWLSTPQKIDPLAVEITADARVEPTPEWTVVIPCFRHQEELVNTLNAVARAIEGRSVEVVVVQDLEPDHEPLAARQNIPALWVSVRRDRPRTFGDRGFRAGAIRNLGVRMSRGKNLLFLDADVLLPADFFQKVDGFDGETTLAQARRWHVADATRFSTPVESLSPLWDCVMSEEGLWEAFQTDPRPWMDHARPWRWTSTFCLAVSRRRFAALGGFRESFDSYGFEDTEFGWRHVQNGGDLKLLPVDVFHQWRPRERQPGVLTRSSEIAGRWTMWRMMS